MLLGLACAGAADRYLGLLHTLLEEWDDAESSFERAAALEARVGGRALVPRTRFSHTRMLIARDDGHDRDAARAILDEVMNESAALGMRRLHQQAAEFRSG